MTDDTLLDLTEANPELEQTSTAYLGLSDAEVMAALSSRERYELEPTPQMAPNRILELAQPSALSDDELRAWFSERGYDLIVDLETGGRGYYEARRGINKRPHWPGGASGVTIGCGYDLGYHTRAEFQAAWGMHFSPEHFTLLSGAIGKKGRSARRYMPRVRHIVIEWGTALAVFDAVTLPKYAKLTFRHLPNALELHPHCISALVSLVFNRGASFRRAGHRYREMRAIRRHVDQREFDKIPDEFRSMKRIWQGVGLDGLLIRRDKEADLFEDGLDAMKLAAQPAETRAHLAAVGAPSAMAGIADMAGIDEDPDLDWLEGLTQDQLDAVIMEPDVDDERSILESDFAAELMAARRYSRSDVRWVRNDENHPDYTHLPPDAKGQSFQFSVSDLEALIRANRFAPHFGNHNRVIFALRGARLNGQGHSQEQRSELSLIDARPDHRRFRCVIGIYDRGAGTLSGYTASTVCNAGAVVKCYNYYNGFSRKKHGNILPAGCYEMCVGTHYGSVTVPGVFRLGNGPGPSHASKQTVLRSGNDVTYGTKDIWDPCKPKDNLHPAFGNNSFSSLGCLTVRGTYRGRGRHTNEWSKLRARAGLDSDVSMGTRYDMVLLTGLDAATVASLRMQQITDEPSLDEVVGCLRHGSQGPLVEKLQAKLSIAVTGEFEWSTVEALANHQRSTLGWASGNYGRNMDALLGFEIFGPAVVDS